MATRLRYRCSYCHEDFPKPQKSPAHSRCRTEHQKQRRLDALDRYLAVTPCVYCEESGKPGAQAINPDTDACLDRSQIASGPVSEFIQRLEDDYNVVCAECRLQ